MILLSPSVQWQLFKVSDAGRGGTHQGNGRGGSKEWGKVHHVSELGANLFYVLLFPLSLARGVLFKSCFFVWFSKIICKPWYIGGLLGARQNEHKQHNLNELVRASMITFYKFVKQTLQVSGKKISRNIWTNHSYLILQRIYNILDKLT